MLLNKGMVSLRYLEMVVPLSGEENSYFGIFHFDFNIRSGKSRLIQLGKLTNKQLFAGFLLQRQFQDGLVVVDAEPLMEC